MPPRKAHSKSRRGCQECKRRHTKCDEQRPRCSTCTRLGIDCTWPDWKPRNASPVPPAEDSRSSTPSLIEKFSNVSTNQPEGASNALSGELAIDDLKLLHHFTAHTYATLNTVVSHQKIFRESIVEIGFKHPFVLRGILAVSALHLATLHPDMSGGYVMQAANQQDLALLEFRDAIQNIGEDNCAAVFVSSFLTATHAFGVAQIHSPQDPILDFLDSLRLVRGIGTVIQPHYDTLLKSELAPLLNNSPDPEIRGEIEEIFQLRDLVSLIPDGNDGKSEVYLHAIDLLNQILTESQNMDPEKSYLTLLFSWPVYIHPEFNFALSAYEPVALIILAHYVGIFGHKRTVWYIMNSSERVIDDIETKLSPDLHHWLIWPRQMCGTG